MSIQKQAIDKTCFECRILKHSGNDNDHNVEMYNFSQDEFPEYKIGI